MHTAMGYSKRCFFYGTLLMMIFILCGCTERQLSTIEKSNHVFGYVALATDGGFVLDEPANAIAVGDVSIRATYCDEKSDFFCIDSDVFYFAVPKTLTGKQQNWNLGGHTYHVEIPLHEILLLGKRIHVEVITTLGPKPVNKPAPDIYFLYSPEAGLLAVESRATGNLATDILISTAKIGFGAQLRNMK